MADKKDDSMIYPLRVSAELGGKIRSVSKATKLGNAEVMRRAIAHGLAAVRKLFTFPK